MRILIAEDDFVSRRLLQRLLERHGECDVAVNGAEAVKAFQLAWEEGKPYVLVCLDIMMPGMDGNAVLKHIRDIEQGRGIRANEGVKVIMTTALSDRSCVLTAAGLRCDAYLVKPFDRTRLLKELESLGLIREPA